MPAKRELRAVALGRKNYSFASSDAERRASLWRSTGFTCEGQREDAKLYSGDGC